LPNLIAIVVLRRLSAAGQTAQQPVPAVVGRTVTRFARSLGAERELGDRRRPGTLGR
jgi:hypothetical protein